MSDGGGGSFVLDGGVFAVELRGEVGLRDGGVGWGEVVALEAEGADPDLGSEVDGGEGIEDGAADAAAEGGVGEDGGGDGFEGGVDGGDGDDGGGGVGFGAGDDVPGEADAVLGFEIGEGRHGETLTLTLILGEEEGEGGSDGVV